jgi:hypothetical protein
MSLENVMKYFSAEQGIGFSREVVLDLVSRRRCIAAGFSETSVTTTLRGLECGVRPVDVVDAARQSQKTSRQ